MKAREMEMEMQKEELGASEGEALRVLVEDVDFDADEVDHVEGGDEREGRGRSMMKVDSRERNEVVTPRD